MTFTEIIAQARIRLNETTASFWTDAELLAHAVNGCKDLWGAIIDLHQEHFLTIDETNVSLAASSTSLAGVPATVFRVHTLEPRDMTASNSVQNLTFVPRDYNHADFAAARARGTVSAPGETVYFCLIGAGAPNAAPTIVVAPMLSSEVLLRLGYIRTIAAAEFETGDAQPIPGEADNAIINWVVAHAIGKQREDQTPDAGWLTLYATEKKNILVRLTPRQTVEPDFAEAFFEEYW